MAKEVGNIGEEKRCGTLRMGLFFDGTGNDHRNKAAWSNVKKLFDLYPNPINPDNDQVNINKPAKDEHDETGYPFRQAAYIRGVGSRDKDVYDKSLARYKTDLEETKRRLAYQKKHYGHVHNRGTQAGIRNLEKQVEDMEANPNSYMSPDRLGIFSKDYYVGMYEKYAGGGLGAGGIARLQGMLWYIDLMVKNFNKEKSHYPKYLEFDIFGFSRGAAEARHFVNVLKQEGDWWQISTEYDKKHVKITSLNIFDTVGSFGIPGKDIDPGFTYYINPSWISTNSITHIVADDEYRYNFDGQFLGENDKDYPVDRGNEFVVLGAHSDVGGGYTKALQHERSSNDLAKVYLNMMYDRCVGYGVPLMKHPKNEDWEIPEEIKNLIKYFKDQYSKHGNRLKIAHKKLREWQRAKGSTYNLDDVRISNIEYMRMHHPRSQLQRHSIFPVMGMITDAITATPDDVKSKYIVRLRQILGSEAAYLEFVTKSNKLYNEYIHISSDESVPMGTQKGYAGIPHRTYFTPQKEDMQKLTRETAYLRHNAIRDNCLPKSTPKGVLAKGNIYEATVQCAVGVTGTYLGSANKTFDKLRGIKLGKKES